MVVCVSVEERRFCCHNDKNIMSQRTGERIGKKTLEILVPPTDDHLAAAAIQMVMVNRTT